MDVYRTVTEVLKFDMRMNLKTRKVPIHTSYAPSAVLCFLIGHGPVPTHWWYMPSASPAVQVEIKTNKAQQDTGLLQKAADYVHAYLLGVQYSPQPT